ncbi:MAG: sensor histidine kinase [Candidatus Limnocylindrales bacterium]
MTNDSATAPAAGLQAFSERLADDLLTLDKELGEVDLLITQAKAESTRHEARRVAAADKLAALSPDGDAKDRVDQTANLVTLTKRAALMETQVEVLEGKRRALARYRDAVADYISAVGAIDPTALPAGADGAVELSPDAPMPAAVSRLLATAQEDLRREIARAMHDGPAQSLTNIVLQAQIVERLAARDPAASAGELRQLIAMVQQTLEATKTFIFDVRPMVLDDLGLVPTLRRATRERGQRAGVKVEFDSLGQDRRLPMDLESSLFRMLDEALSAYLEAAPDRVTLRLDWGDELEAVLEATRAVVEPPPSTGVAIPTEEAGKDLPPALAAMVEDRRAVERNAAQAAMRDSIVVLPGAVWREIQGRASSVGVEAELLGDGSRLRLVATIPPLQPVAEATPEAS